ncbi:hypothetical protein [Corallococcus exercitus]|uniref:hypothetical protein n=1 Tax=Corallococcus exercitus TaxID=2316736 RepID=UPI0035D4B9C0
MRTWPSHHRRFGAAFLAAVWLVVPLLALLHGSHVHRFCAAHGTFEEAHASGEERARAGVDAAGTRLLEAAAEAFAGGHEECPLMGAWARQGLPGASRAWVTAVTFEAECRAVCPRRVPPQVAPLTVAPKGSPPRA